MELPEVITPCVNTDTALGHIAAPVDIAISKLGRATDQDIGDIKALLRAGFILTREFRRLALQAIDVYVGNKEAPISVLTNILHDYLESTDDEAP